MEEIMACATLVKMAVRQATTTGMNDGKGTDGRNSNTRRK